MCRRPTQSTGKQQQAEEQTRSNFWLPAGLFDEESSNTPHQSPETQQRRLILSDSSHQAIRPLENLRRVHVTTHSDQGEDSGIRATAPEFQPGSLQRSPTLPRQMLAWPLQPGSLHNSQPGPPQSMTQMTLQTQWRQPSDSWLRPFPRYTVGHSGVPMHHPETVRIRSWSPQHQRSAETSRTQQAHLPHQANLLPQPSSSASSMQVITPTATVSHEFGSAEQSMSTEQAAITGTPHRKSSRSSRRVTEKSLRTCYRCRRKGHEAADCPALPPDAPWGSPSRKPGSKS